MGTNSETRIFALLGHPVSNSFSPNMHSYLFEKYGVNGAYLCFDIEPRKIYKSIEAMRLLNTVGFNVTIPYKTDVMAGLDEIDRNAELIGAVNTVKNEGGVLKGYNTDGRGFVKAITDRNIHLEGKSAIILGCGGACRSIAIEMASNEIKKIDIRNRSIENAEKIAKRVGTVFGTEVVYSSMAVSKEDLEEYDFLINTTPIGMESDECPIDEDVKVSSDIVVYDIVYKPHRTNLIKWAEKNNLRVIHGIDMLINQGIEAFEIWTGKKVDSKDAEILKEMFQSERI
ncbi:shikimate dehydrogenase [Peptacetobacter sp. AB845]|uniref:shikimate dehydrogenase n=1 Tax=Peptacetobacter sp. AB845 TaxID=3388429 RepID=UPI0039C95B96